MVLSGFAEFAQSSGSAISLSTYSSVIYTTEVYYTTSSVTQNQLNGGSFNVEMIPVWYDIVHYGGGLMIFRYFQKEVQLTWQITNVSSRRMNNVTVAMHFLHRGDWTRPVVISAGDLEPNEATIFTRRSTTEIQLDTTSEPYFYYIAGSVATSDTTTRALTSLYVISATMATSSYTATVRDLPGMTASMTWMWIVALH